MTLTVTASGTQSATVSTEHTLAGTGTLTAGKTYTLAVDCNAMATGDELELRIKTKVLSSGTERLAYIATYAHAQDTPIKVSIPVPCAQAATVTLKQTAGTGRSYDWNITTPD